MKRITLTILAIVMTFCGIQAQDTATEIATNLRNLDDCLQKIADQYGIKDKAILRRDVNPLTNRLKSGSEIVPFKQNGENDDGLLSKLIAQADSAFFQCVMTRSCYKFGRIYPHTPDSDYTIYTGETVADKLTIMDAGEDAKLVFMEVKESEDPTLRWFYGLKWTGEGSHLSGTIYTILSKRPDLIELEQNAPVQSHITADPSKSRTPEDIMASIDEATKKKIFMLDLLLEQYDDEQKNLYGLYRNALNFNNAELKTSITKQIEALMKKRQEALDKLHKIAMTIK